ncbi:MAG: LPS assembly lipoprotein LptE [Steroidobacteraceae bacterium]
MRAAILLVLAFTGMAGCGFHLQGRQTLPAALSTIYVDPKDAQSEFTQALRAQLTVSGAHVLPAAVSDAATVTVLRDELTERVLSVSARNIPTDYELSYEVEVSVSAGGRELMAREPFSLSRVYSFDETRLLAKEREKEILAGALARDMASVVVRRLGAL